jgi:hypothetical protein
MTRIQATLAASAAILVNLASVPAWTEEEAEPSLPYRDGPLGAIDAGAYADLLLERGNPLEDACILSDYEGIGEKSCVSGSLVSQLRGGWRAQLLQGIRDVGGRIAANGVSCVGDSAPDATDHDSDSKQEHDGVS